jgi:hypothetical protein
MQREISAELLLDSEASGLRKRERPDEIARPFGFYF